MCGIVAYVGPRQAQPLLIEGLKQLEYRGYDSAGLAVIDAQKEIQFERSVGRVSVLESQIEKRGGLLGTTGIAHTRWATHGQPTLNNAHPHFSNDQKLALVHNGIIENYVTLRKYLEKRGHEFRSETDTEVLTLLISELMTSEKLSLEKAVQTALREVTGAYAIAVICADEPNTLVVARKGSPLLIGLADGAFVVASDGSAIVSHTTQVISLSDYQVARLCIDDELNPLRTTTLDDNETPHVVEELEMDLSQIELNGYPHYMLKEIMEQPESLANCFKGRIDLREGQVVLGGLTTLARKLARINRIILTGQGTAWHAGLVGEYLLEDLAKVPCEVEYASEFRYRNPIIEDDTVMICISQSGETADTLAALKEAKERGARTLGVINVVGSTITKETDAGVYLRSGPEIGVASTKAFLGQLGVLTMIALYIGRRRYLSSDALKGYLKEMDNLPAQIEKVLQQSEMIKEAVAGLIDRENWLFLGRGYHYPVALEGALKLKEISYIHAEGMPAAEMKHGPIALIDEGMPVVFVVPQGSQYEKAISNIEEVKARGGKIIAVADEEDTNIQRYADIVFRIPVVSEPIQPMLSVIPLQLLAYHAAVLRGHDVDKPRNLAKSVTVE